MKANDLVPPPHLEAGDLEKDVFVTITGVDFEEVGEEKGRKGVLHLKEFSRSMVLNRTNLKRIVMQHGDQTDDWIGKGIVIYGSETEFAGRTVPCIRVRSLPI